MDAPDQLSLFGRGGVDPTGPAAVVTPAQRALAARLPAHVHLGTSSWTFPGWAGIVYAGHPSKEQLVERGLEAYAKHPLLRTVGVDRSYYEPLTVEQWRAYARQLPSGFRVVAKAWSEVTTAVFADHPRLGARAGQRNPAFLDPALTLSHVARPYLEGMGEHAGPLVFELPQIPERLLPRQDDFLARLSALFDAMPAGLPLAVELRTRALLSLPYLDLLRARNVSHVVNFWTAMPTPAEQAALGADEPGADVIFRLMLPPGARYAELEAAYAPYDRIVAPQPAMRREVLEIIERAVAKGRGAFVIVNNKVEGSSPLTVFALAEALAERAR